MLGHPGQSWFVWGWAPDPSWALHYPFLGFQTFFKNRKLNNSNLSISVVKTVRNASWSGFPISEESQFGVEEIEAKMQREGEMRDRERGSWWPLSPWFYMFLRLSKVGFYGIRPWDGVWGAGYLLGSNTHRKEGRKQGWVEGEIELQRRSKKALADPTESSAAHTSLELSCMDRGSLVFILPQWPVTESGLPREGCVLGWDSSIAEANPEGVDSWRLSTDHTASIWANTSFFETDLGCTSPVHQRPTFSLPSFCFMFNSFDYEMHSNMLSIHFYFCQIKVKLGFYHLPPRKS